MFWLTYDSENTLGVSAIPLGALCLLIHASASPTMCAIVVSSFYSSLTTFLILYLCSSYFEVEPVFACRSHSPVVFLINVISIRS